MTFPASGTHVDTVRRWEDSSAKGSTLFVICWIHTNNHNVANPPRQSRQQVTGTQACKFRSAFYELLISVVLALYTIKSVLHNSKHF